VAHRSWRHGCGCRQTL